MTRVVPNSQCTTYHAALMALPLQTHTYVHQCLHWADLEWQSRVCSNLEWGQKNILPENNVWKLSSAYECAWKRMWFFAVPLGPEDRKKRLQPHEDHDGKTKLHMSVVRGHHRELVDGNRNCSCRKNHSHYLPFITKGWLIQLALNIHIHSWTRTHAFFGVLSWVSVS